MILFCVSCRDPGLMERVTDEESAENGWFWNEQVGSYRPQGAMYCRECQVSNPLLRIPIFHFSYDFSGWNRHSNLDHLPLSRQALVHDYDHVCPWTGTAIGKGNMLQFKLFVFSVNVLCYLSIGLAVWQIMDKVMWSDDIMDTVVRHQTSNDTMDQVTSKTIEISSKNGSNWYL